MIKTETAEAMANASAGSGPKASQAKNAAMATATTVGTNAALLAGFAFTGVIEAPWELLREENKPYWLQSLCLMSTLLGMLFEVLAIVKAVQLSILGPGLAIRTLCATEPYLTEEYDRSSAALAAECARHPELRLTSALLPVRTVGVQARAQRHTRFAHSVHPPRP